MIGLGAPCSGGSLLRDIFTQNGYLWRHHQGGKLARSIAFAKAAGQMPLGRWPKADGFSGLYDAAKLQIPQLFGYREFEFLQGHFPDAYFILTYWNANACARFRLAASTDQTRTVEALHHNVEPDQLPAIWEAQDLQHRQECLDFFSGSKRFLALDLENDLSPLIEFLALDFTLEIPPDLPGFPPPHGATEPLGRLIAPPPLPPADIAFAQEVADYCAARPGGHGSPKHLSNQAIKWKVNNTFVTNDLSPAPMVLGGDEQPVLLKPGMEKLQREQAALNALRAHGAKAPLWIDMMDARTAGSHPDQPMPPARTVAYNRREDARNITLWPLPGYHEMAPIGTLGGEIPDKMPFADKQDKCVWLGNLTGRMIAALTPEDRPKRNVYAIRDDARRLRETGGDWEGILRDLACVPRYRVVSTFHDHPDFILGFTLKRKWRNLAETPIFRGLLHSFEKPSWFHNFRYVLSLSGNDTGSNFLPAAASNSLILKEEDGWELFYTEAFKPWEHYVPLVPGALDLPDKLAWARANPEACEAMVEASTKLYQKFAHPENRAAYLGMIAKKLNIGASTE